jgi:hypothetical protein
MAAQQTATQNPQPKSNVQKLTSLFTGYSSSGSVPSPMEMGNTTPHGGKRGRVEDGTASGSVVDDTVISCTKLDLYELLDDSMAKAMDNTKAATKELLGKFHDKIEGRFVAVEGRVGKVETTVSGMATDLTELQSSIVEIQKEQARQAEALLLANRTGVLTWADLQSDEFDRPPNIEVVRVSCPKFVSKSSIENALTPFLSDLGYPKETWSVTGNEGGKEFFVQFLQNALTSAKNVKHVLQNLKVNGKYRIFMAETVKVDPTTGKPQSAKLFVSGDQNPKQKAVRFMCTKFTEVCKSQYPNLDWSYYDGVVQFCEEGEKFREGLAIMLPTKSSVDRTMVQWDNTLVDKFKFDKTKILDLFETMSAGPAAAKEWCV